MSKHLCTLAAALVAGAAALATPTSAMPVSQAFALKNAAGNAAPGSVEQVRWGWGWGLGGFAAGAIIGSAIVAPRYYGYPYGYYPAYGYPPPPPPPGYYGAAPAGDGVAYCMQKYKSYDPNSGTFLGYDGARHPCP
jgi:hypothetical protein